MRRMFIGILAACVLAAPVAAGRTSAAANALTIYFIDVEGGQSTLIITPAGESFLIDTGFPGAGTFASKPGDPSKARDAQRILAAARDAGVKQIDYLMLTHYHADHAGGVVELAQLLPIRTFIDHAAPNPDADKAVAGTQAVYDLYLALRAKGRHLEPRPGDQVPLKGITAVIVASAGDVIAKPLAGAGQVNGACTSNGIPASEKTENPRSTAVRLAYGKFSFLDLGDLTGPPLFALTCPRNLIGDASVYLVAHHGGNDAADPSLYRATTPIVAITNNAEKKGAQANTMATLQELASTTDTWQLHRTAAEGATNVASDRIANLDDTTSAWIKISANDDGSFSVTNGRTGYAKTYKR